MLELVKIEDNTTATEAQELAFEIWKEHYIGIVSAMQVDYMLENQTAEAILRLIPEGYCYYLMKLDEDYIGYTAVCNKLAFEDRALISKLYIKQEYRNKGYGQQVIAFHKENAIKDGFKGLYLYVNKKNNALDAYEKIGFTVHHPVITEIGNGFVMDDFVMTMDF